MQIYQKIIKQLTGKIKLMTSEKNKGSAFLQIEKDLGVNLANSLVNISLVDGFLWVKNPKVGSSTLDKTLQSVASRSLGDIPNTPHARIENSVFVKPFQLPVEQIDRIFSDDSIYRFTFVRNPYRRIFSAYVDKILGGTQNKVQILRYAGKDRKDLTAEITFDQYVEALSKIEINKMDRHWMPQHILTLKKHIKYDFIGRLENFDEDLGKVFDSIKQNIDEHYKYYAPHKNVKKLRIEDYLDNQNTLDIINKIYHEDFIEFGYSKVADVSYFKKSKAA